MKSSGTDSIALVLEPGVQADDLLRAWSCICLACLGYFSSILSWRNSVFLERNSFSRLYGLLQMVHRFLPAAIARFLKPLRPARLLLPDQPGPLLANSGPELSLRHWILILLPKPSHIRQFVLANGISFFRNGTCAPDQR